MTLRRLLKVLPLTALMGACAVMPQNNKPVIQMAPIEGGAYTTAPYAMGQDEIAQTLSNENVIVYPIDGDLKQYPRTFPEYRGVLDNTTAGGYTVFDSSVTVYAVEGDASMRPSYLPDYAVPKYAEQYRTPDAPMASYQGMADPLTPMGVVPLHSPVPIAQASRVNHAGRISRPWMEVEAEALPARTVTARENLMPMPDSQTHLPRPPQEATMVTAPAAPAPVDTARRSAPMLTGY